MINANELRKGIYLKASNLHEGVVMSVRYFDDEKTLHSDCSPVVFFNESPIGEYLKDCEPIPLTPEVLEGCGFSKHENKNLLFLKEFRYSLNEKSITLLRSCDKAGESQKHWCGFPFLTDNIKCTSLHQLQNLYYALTGEELIYTPTAKK